MSEQPECSARRTPHGWRMACALACGALTLASGRPAWAEDEGEDAGAATNAPAAKAAVAPTYGRLPRYSARLRVSYDHREQGEDRDRDLYGYFYGQGRGLQDDRFDFYTSLRLHTDFDDTSSRSLAEDPFQSTDDAGSVTDQRVLQLYGDLHTRDKRLALRGGRQYVEIADYLQMDGAQIMLFEQERLGGRIYAGHPVSYYSSTSGDYAGGLSLVGRPWAGNQSRLTLARYHDDSANRSDDNVYGDVRQQLTDRTRLRGQVSVLNEEFRMGRLDWSYTSEGGETDLSLGGSYWGSYDARTRAYSPLYDTLGEAQPYTYTYARLTQEILPWFLVSPGASLRFAEDGDNDYNNRDYENVDLTLIFKLGKPLTASIALEHWAVEDSDSFSGVTGELRYRHLRVWELAGGVSYAQYTYDTYSDISYTVNGGQTVFSEGGTVIEESPYVKTYYLRSRWKVSRHLALRLQMDVEDDESADDLAYRGRGSVEVRY